MKKLKNEFRWPGGRFIEDQGGSSPSISQILFAKFF